MGAVCVARFSASDVTVPGEEGVLAVRMGRHSSGSIMLLFGSPCSHSFTGFPHASVPHRAGRGLWFFLQGAVSSRMMTGVAVYGDGKIRLVAPPVHVC